MEVSGGWNESFWQAQMVQFFSQKKGTDQAYQNNSIHHETNFL